MADPWMYQPAPSEQSPNGPDSESSKASPPNLSVFRDNTAPQDASKSTAPPRIRRRNRLITSCLECRRRKLKCDKQAPCTNCTRFKRDCLYLAPALDSSSQQKLADIKERMGALEKNLEREVSGRTAKVHIGGSHILPQHQIVKAEEDYGEDDDEVEDEEALEPTPLAALDAGYEDNGDDEMMDLGVQMGKMRITDRIGGWIRPKLVDELTDTLNDVKAGKSRWSGPGVIGYPPDSASTEGRAKLQASPKSYIGPGPDYIAPASSFFFPGTNVSTSLVDYLPSKTVADQLVAQYYSAVHHVAKIVHRPTMEAQYALFWNSIATGNEPLPSLQAIIFAAMFSAAVSMTNDQHLQRLGTTKAALVDSLRSGTEMALSKANFLRTTKVDTMQAFVMYLIPLVRAEVSRAHSALVGTAIRLAECMGLHRDGSHYNMKPVEVHVRRMVWHQLCFLDQRTCEATGPRPQIRKEDYDTKFPANVNDLELINADGTVEEHPYWTDNTLFRIRAECSEIRRQVWFDIIALDKKKKTLTSVLVRVQKFRNALENKYFPMLDDNNPLHIYTRHVMALGVNGLYIQILHRYLFSTTTKMPDRLRQVLIEAGLAQMENAIALETTPSIATWSWYKGAFNQYHSALLLMVEVYAYPMRKDAAKIWKCLDYIFDIPPHLSPKQKAELVITDLRDRMEIFHQMRRVRATTQMEARVHSMGSASSMRERGVDVSPGALPPGQASLDQQQQQLLPQHQVPLVDSFGQMNQQSMLTAPTAPPLVPQAQFPPQYAQQADALTPSDSRSGSVGSGQPPASLGVGAGGDILMDDIDWNEWDKYFPVETNTGDLNIPDFNFSEFTGGGGGGGGGGSFTNDFDPNNTYASNNDSNIHGNSHRQQQQQQQESLSDLNLGSMTFFPAHYARNSSGGGGGGGGGGGSGGRR
ncbi:hypothetical protein Q7P37_008379 [Cladosporium fusiforme]